MRPAAPELAEFQLPNWVSNYYERLFYNTDGSSLAGVSVAQTGAGASCNGDDANHRSGTKFLVNMVVEPLMPCSFLLSSYLCL